PLFHPLGVSNQIHLGSMVYLIGYAGGALPGVLGLEGRRDEALGLVEEPAPEPDRAKLLPQSEPHRPIGRQAGRTDGRRPTGARSPSTGQWRRTRRSAGRPALVGARSWGQAEQAAIRSRRASSVTWSSGPAVDAELRKRPSGSTGEFWNRLTGSGTRQSGIPWGASTSTKFIRQLRWSSTPKSRR